MFLDPETVGIIGWERERQADQNVTGTWRGLGPQLVSELRNDGASARRPGRQRRSFLKAATDLVRMTARSRRWRVGLTEPP